SAGAHYFNGSSLSLNGTPSLGQLQISQPGAATGSPDLAVTKTPSATSVSPGSTVTYTLGYQNKAAAASSATGVQMTDTLPASVVGSAICTGCSILGNVVTWDLGTLAPGASGSKTLIITIPSSAVSTDTFPDTVDINSAENDANAADNTASLTTAVSASPAAKFGFTTTPQTTAAGVTSGS